MKNTWYNIMVILGQNQNQDFFFLKSFQVLQKVFPFLATLEGCKKGEVFAIYYSCAELVF